MDYSYKIHEKNVEINENLDEVKVIYILSGKAELHDKISVEHFEENEFLIIEPYTSPKLLVTTGIVMEISINKFSFNRFSLYKMRQLDVESQQLDLAIKKQFLDTVIYLYEEDFFNADINVVKLINYIRDAQYYSQDNLGINNNLIKTILKYIFEHHKENITLSKISKVFYVNPSYLSRVFSEEMNISITKYIIKVKIYRLAVEMLTMDTTKDLWRNYGYKSYSTFSKNFKSVFMKSPEQFLEDYKTPDVKESYDFKLNFDYLKQLSQKIDNAIQS